MLLGSQAWRPVSNPLRSTRKKKKAHNGESFVAFPRLVGLLAD